MAESRIAIYGAIAANVAIATTKFIVAGITGSSAMLSEGIHSAVDTFNGVLLLVGVHLSHRPATERHPFGHGKELYFWSLIVAVLIFGVGGGVSFYEGIVHVRRPVPIDDPFWNYVVLSLAGLFEGMSFLVALRQFRQGSRGRPFWRALSQSKDPSTYTVLAEDGAALLGLAIAALGIWSSERLGMPQLDGVASMLIGLLLCAVAVMLIRESRGLLIGEGIRPETARAIRALALAQAPVAEVGSIRSMYIGPDEALVTIDVDFRAGASTAEASAALARMQAEVRARFPMIKRLYVEGPSEPTAAASGPAAPLAHR